MPSDSDELIETQLSTLQLLLSMYPLSSELSLSPSTSTFLDDPSSFPPPIALEADLHLPLDEHSDSTDITVDDGEMVLHILLPLQSNDSDSNSDSDRQGRAIVRPRQPTWLSRAHYSDLLSNIPPQEIGTEASEYILSTIEHVRSALIDLRPSTSTSGVKTPNEEKEMVQLPEERVWFWFPTLSTREKRDDIVRYAEEVGLTGFVLAGKPALLCVEGHGPTIDKYMSRIKSESWADIPAFQKKVTERLRRPLASPSHRAFSDMKEITHLIPKYGQYNHRGEMGEVRRLMEEWGVGDDFGAVVLNSGS
ncbi:hypothetical protein CI109_100829 [Kwoniella shandongensis]|uniref:Uncharacterized protein n=1 Tax=Kwoniella shandongensis TaxID=1734106 RepID=A0A5M6BT21_9TREE|nr:uncharacterized protein CI109_006919 [Kwoniella shandongensis]KAA5524765.1 hypothetical protein CI109_006919 [Kwoniella shandongensis]